MPLASLLVSCVRCGPGGALALAPAGDPNRDGSECECLLAELDRAATEGRPGDGCTMVTASPANGLGSPGKSHPARGS